MDVFRGDVLGIIYISFWGFWHLKVQIILCFIDIIQPQAITMVILPPELRYFCYYVYDVNLTLEFNRTSCILQFILEYTGSVEWTQNSWYSEDHCHVENETSPSATVICPTTGYHTFGILDQSLTKMVSV